MDVWLVSNTTDKPLSLGLLISTQQRERKLLLVRSFRAVCKPKAGLICSI